MSTKHLSIGSVAPPLVPGKLRLYSMRFCPFAHRIHLVLESKKIPYDVVYINTSKQPEWYLKKSPLGKVPCIELNNGELLTESLIIVDYLNEAYQPEENLYPRDPLLKAQDKLVLEQFSALTFQMYKLFVDVSINHELFNEALNCLEIFNKELVKRGNIFFNGSKPGMLDLMMWPWFERADIIRILKGEQFILPRERFLRLLQWKALMRETPAVQKHYLSPDIHAQFMKGYAAGTPDFDTRTE